MRTYDILLNGTDETRLIIDYKFFLILTDGGYTLDVSVWKKNGYQKVQGVAAGFGLKLNEDSRGKEFVFSSANAQTIKIFAGDDEAIYNRLSGTVTVNGGSLASIVSLGGITATVKVADDGESYGASYKSHTIMASNTPDTIVSPASNVNGLVIQRASFMSYSGGVMLYPAFIAKTSSPVNALDGDVILGTRAGANGTFCAFIDEPIRIAAGKGLYYVNGNAESNSQRSVLYTLL